MKIDVVSISAHQFIRNLGGLKTVLHKAATYAELKKIDPIVLFNTRLVPDQFALNKQIQIACDTAKFCIARLTDLTPPSFDDSETSLEEFIDRIDQTIAFLATVKADDFKGYESREITFYWNPGFKLSGDVYLQQHALPNFYFHLTAAYSILRSVGVDLGKSDFLGAMDWQKV